MRNPISSSKLAKLPKWAQEYMRQQERLIAYWRDQAKDFEHKGTGIAWGRVTVSGVTDWAPIPEGAVVRFGTDDEYIDAMQVQGALNIQASRSTAIVPHSTGGSILIVNVDHDWYTNGAQAATPKKDTP